MAEWSKNDVAAIGSLNLNLEIYRYPIDRVPLHTRLKSRQVTWCAFTHCDVPYGTRPRPLTEVGSGAATCHMALDLASWLK
jgi:hypothetical protein